MNWLSRVFGKSRILGLEELASCLLDKSIEFGDRDDIAMDLGNSDSPLAEKALLHVVLDHSDDEMIVDSAAESLLQIWSRQQKKPDASLVGRMHPAAKRYFTAGDA